MKKNIVLMVSILTIIIACESDNESKKIKSYLGNFSYGLADFKVICFIPIDGCGSCINPSLEYAKQSDNRMLLVLTSIYRKSIDYTIENHKIDKTELIIDSKNQASTNGLVTNIAPCYYFLKDGEIVKKVDLTNLPDKSSILDEVDSFLKQ